MQFALVMRGGGLGGCVVPWSLANNVDDIRGTGCSIPVRLQFLLKGQFREEVK